jgi:hypothetical protein
MAGRNRFLLVHPDHSKARVDENRAGDDTVIDPAGRLAR